MTRIGPLLERVARLEARAAENRRLIDALAVTVEAAIDQLADAIATHQADKKGHHG